MALGNPNSNYDNNKKKNYSPSTYSAYSFRNPESVIDKTAMSITFWNKMLKVSISPKVNNEQNTYDYDNGISIYLDHFKAKVLLNEIEQFQSGIEFNNGGVNSSDGLISISNGKEFGVEFPCIVIRKVDPETLVETSSFAYQFKTDYYYSIRNYNAESGECVRLLDDYNTLELESFKTLLNEYIKAMTGAVAYSVIDELKYDQSRTKTKLDLIMDKLGIKMSGSNGGGGSRSSSYSAFNKVPATNSYKTASADELDDILG